MKFLSNSFVVLAVVGLIGFLIAFCVSFGLVLWDLFVQTPPPVNWDLSTKALVWPFVVFMISGSLSMIVESISGREN